MYNTIYKEALKINSDGDAATVNTRELIKQKIDPQNFYLLRFDGCSKGNPGMAAAGAVLYKNETEIWSGGKFLGFNETNNYAEYMGLIMGLSKAVEFNITDLIVEGDSMLIINQMNIFIV
jgi:ribonuclease HI